MEEKWSVDLGEEAPSAVIPYASGISDRPDIAIVTCKDKGVMAFDGAGRKVWSYPMPSYVYSSVAVGDLDGDGQNEIVAADANGNLVCLGPDGKPKWTSRLRGQVFQWNSPSIFDLDNDGHNEIVIGNDRGYVTCFDSGGKLIWEFRGDRGSVSPLSVGDVNGDGVPEIIYGSDAGRVYCLSGDGKWLWEMDPDEDSPFGRSAPAVADINLDGRMEVLIAKSNYSPRQRLYALDAATGKVLWDFETELHVYSCLAVGDINLDGEPEIICGDKATTVYCLDGRGREIWKTPLEGTGIFNGPVLADVRGDSLFEVVVGVRRNGGTVPALYVLSPDGKLLESHPVTGRGIIGSPAAFDIDGDGKVEILFIATSPAKLVCLKTDGVSEGLWPCYRRDKGHTGYVAPQTIAREVTPAPEKISKVNIEMLEFEGPFLGKNIFSFDVLNPEGEKVLISFSMEGPNGSFTEMKRGEGTQGRIDFSFDILRKGDYTLRYSVIDSESGAIMIRRKKSFSVSPPREDIEFIRNEMEELDSLRSELGVRCADASAYLKNKLFELKGRLSELEDIASGIEDFSEDELRALAKELTLMRNEISRLWNISSFVMEHGISFGDGILVWSTPNPWGPFSYEMEIPDDGKPVDVVKVSSYVNEYESLAINITNVGLRSIDLLVSVDDLRLKDGTGVLKTSDCIELRNTVMVPSIDGGYVPDALPRLDQSNRISIPSWESRQLWITVQAKGASEGVYTGRIRLKALYEENASMDIPLELRVYPIAIPSKSRMAFCNWTSVPLDDRRKLDDLLNHYTNVFIMGAPSVRFNPDCEIVGEINYSRYDATFRELKGRAIFLIPAFQSTVRFTEPVPYMSDTWKKAYAKWLKIWVEHLKEIGIGYEDFALYPYDEPGLFKGPIIDRVYEVAKLTKEADPHVQVYANPTGGANARNLEKLRPYIDIWCPFLVLIRKDNELLSFLKETGKPIWCYEAEGRVKNLHPLDYYRMQPWVAWRYGLDGAGFWTYEWRVDLRDRWTQYGLIYNGDGPIPSKRWEAYRDGVEDYNYLALLREAADEADSLGVAPDLVGNARKLLEGCVADITRGQERVDDIIRWAEDFPMDFRKLMKYREEIAEMTVALRKALQECKGK